MKRSVFLISIAGAAVFCGAWFFHWRQSSAVLPGIVSSAPFTHHEAHYPLAFIQKLEHDPTAGRQIYEAYCVTCHGDAPVIPLHAPRRLHPEDLAAYATWRDDALFAAAAVGFNAMPARGGCFECSDALLSAAIVYLYYARFNHASPITKRAMSPASTVHKFK